MRSSRPCSCQRSASSPLGRGGSVGRASRRTPRPANGATPRSWGRRGPPHSRRTPRSWSRPARCAWPRRGRRPAPPRRSGRPVPPRGVLPVAVQVQDGVVVATHHLLCQGALAPGDRRPPGGRLPVGRRSWWRQRHPEHGKGLQYPRPGGLQVSDAALEPAGELAPVWTGEPAGEVPRPPRGAPQCRRRPARRGGARTSRLAASAPEVTGSRRCRPPAAPPKRPLLPWQWRRPTRPRRRSRRPGGRPVPRGGRPAASRPYSSAPPPGAAPTDANTMTTQQSR